MISFVCPSFESGRSVVVSAKSGRSVVVARSLGVGEVAGSIPAGPILRIARSPDVWRQVAGSIPAGPIQTIF